jgi:hypothetical protein
MGSLKTVNKYIIAFMGRLISVSPQLSRQYTIIDLYTGIMQVRNGYGGKGVWV